MRRRGPPPELNPTLLEGAPRDLVAEYAENQGLGCAEALAELKKAGQRWKASEKALRAELAAGEAGSPEAAASTAAAASTVAADVETKVQEQPKSPAVGESDLAMWAEWLGGVLCCCFQRDGH
ncbi:unnamed protein product [Symbiodinium natans]|uniref:Uncharacterized protein n=1 Tax=Symbiodinium natans TaxID=878477 RepID=A0A812TPT6_9DINO|nr:unnamed protein product [Symbiodinium natans]